MGIALIIHIGTFLKMKAIVLTVLKCYMSYVR